MSTCVPITFREGLTIKQMGALFEAKGFGRRGDFVHAAANPAPVAALDPAARDLEGYLFPDTYALPRQATAAQLVARMVAGFEKVLTPELRARAAARGLDVRQLVTLASIVEKETGKAEERPLVAAVYSNRLKIGMGLQCDPTVIFALERAGRYDGNLTREDLHFDSPYNTYRYAGLPPGPDRVAGARLPGGGRASGRCARTSTSSAVTTARTRSRQRWPSTITTCSSSRSSRSGSRAQTSAIRHQLVSFGRKSSLSTVTSRPVQ